MPLQWLIVVRYCSSSCANILGFTFLYFVTCGWTAPVQTQKFIALWPGKSKLFVSDTVATAAVVGGRPTSIYSQQILLLLVTCAFCGSLLQPALEQLTQNFILDQFNADSFILSNVWILSKPQKYDFLVNSLQYSELFNKLLP